MGGATVPDGLRRLVVGALDTNCYVLVRDGRALVVDPGAEGGEIARALMSEGVAVESIVCTHGHHDHVCGVAALRRATGATYMISALDAERACHAISYSSHLFDVSGSDLEDAPEPDRLLHEGDVVGIGDVELRVLACPGHTPGGIALAGDGFAFMGDTVFAGSVGRTDLSGGDPAALARTIGRLKREIPADTVLLCGHGPVTTMGRELAYNPFFQGV